MNKGFKNGKVPEIDSISSLTQKFYMEICDEQDKCTITRVFEDMQQNPEKYGRLSYGILTRERLKEVLDKGLRAEEYFEQIVDLKKQIAEKGKEIKSKNDKLCELKQQLKHCQNSLKRKTQSNRDLQHLKHNTNAEFAIEKLQRVKEILVKKMKLATDKLNVAYEVDKIIKEIGGGK